jgi:hypothetical protein
MNDNERIEQIARRLCVIRYPDMDPDTKVCAGLRQQWETPGGPVYMATNDAATIWPFWWLWRADAQVVLDIAQAPIDPNRFTAMAPL